MLKISDNGHYAISHYQLDSHERPSSRHQTLYTWKGHYEINLYLKGEISESGFKMLPAASNDDVKPLRVFGEILLVRGFLLLELA